MCLALEPDVDAVGEAADGQEAVAMAADLRPDVALMDVEMPVIDGITATGRIRELDESARWRRRASLIMAQYRSVCAVDRKR